MLSVRLLGIEKRYHFESFLANMNSWTISVIKGKVLSIRLLWYSVYNIQDFPVTRPVFGSLELKDETCKCTKKFLVIDERWTDIVRPRPFIQSMSDLAIACYIAYITLYYTYDYYARLVMKDNDFIMEALRICLYSIIWTYTVYIVALLIKR